MAEPVPGGLRPAAGPGGLTSPDPVTAPPRPSATRHHATHDPPARFPDEPQNPVSGQTSTPAGNHKITFALPDARETIS
jgi:hypothetical protein